MPRNVDTVICKISEPNKPRDPIEGTILHLRLRPRKMMRTIESKLHGLALYDLNWDCPKTSLIRCEAVSGVCAVKPT